MGAKPHFVDCYGQAAFKTATEQWFQVQIWELADGDNMKKIQSSDSMKIKYRTASMKQNIQHGIVAAAEVMQMTRTYGFDFAPSNIVLESDGNPRVVDYDSVMEARKKHEISANINIQAQQNKKAMTWQPGLDLAAAFHNFVQIISNARIPKRRM